MPGNNSAHPPEVGTLGGGCLWCLEAVFERLRREYAVRLKQ